ncbi:MAG: ABC transporter ATP-binding protein [Candidatus Bipolaricaulota bacterium]|nr:ABC transporter ATP-binding protein [Candidatus Bipolaricaulota bacterium]MDW8126469.1 ABC transporter ATP-binding protein [Candidatus Bipolaricaulota bacterium]
MPLLEVQDLRVYYQTIRGDVKALDGASFSLAEGEIMGLAGESGCGKSTLGRSLVLLKPPMKYVEGRVTLEDFSLPIWDREKMNAFRFSKISLIPQYAMNALNPTRKVKKIFTDILATKGIKGSQVLPELRRRLEMVELPLDVLNMYPIELSGGMKQRVVMVLSTFLNPSLLIADEITSALDVSTQRAVVKMLVDFRDRRVVRAMIVITHDISLLYQIADSILVMYAGKLVEKGTTEEILRAPKHPYTRFLIASLPDIGVRYGERKLEGVPGCPPLLLQPPRGCRFRERCPHAFEKCLEEPPFVAIGPSGRQVACWQALEEHA